MSILDGSFGSPETAAYAAAIAEPVVSAALARLTMTPPQQRVLDLFKQGIPLSGVLGITDKQCDALLARGCHLLQLGESQRARDILTVLYILQPLDARVIYALSLTYQLTGEIETAAKLLIQFLALDATNPDGHLRLGECLLSAKEFDNAAASFSTALRLCQKGHGSPSSRAHALHMVNYVKSLGTAQL